MSMLKHLLDDLTYDELLGLIYENDLESHVYYTYEANYGKVFTHDPTTAELYRFLQAYYETGTIPDRKVWRNNSIHCPK